MLNDSFVLRRARTREFIIFDHFLSVHLRVRTRSNPRDAEPAEGKAI